MKKRKKKTGNALYFILMTVLLGIFVYSAVQLFSELKSYRDDQKAYDELNQYIEVEEVTESEQKDEEVPFEQRVPTIDFESLEEINSDCIGWIYVPNTKIS